MHQDTEHSPTLAETVGQAYERYRTELKRFLGRQSRRAHSSDDLVQEVYVQLLRFPPREELREPQAYLYRIAWHVVNRANLRAQQEALPMDPQSMERAAGAAWGEQPDDTLVREQQLSRLLAPLPRPCQAALVLFKRDGLSYKEIAERLNISVHTVKKHIARALAHFKTQLKTGDWDL